MSLKSCQGSKILLFAALSGALGVGLGAFAAHKLPQFVSSHFVDVFNTGVLYQMLHSLVLLGLVLFIRFAPNEKIHRRFILSSAFFIGGIFCFSGSLYALVLTGVTWFGPITPIGGVLFILGWLTLASGAMLMIKEER